MSTISSIVQDGVVDLTPFIINAGKLVREAYDIHHRLYYVVDIIFKDEPTLIVEYKLWSFTNQPDYMVARGPVLIKASTIEKVLSTSQIGKPGNMHILINRIMPNGVTIVGESSFPSKVNL